MYQDHFYFISSKHIRWITEEWKAYFPSSTIPTSLLKRWLSLYRSQISLCFMHEWGTPGPKLQEVTWDQISDSSVISTNIKLITLSIWFKLGKNSSLLCVHGFWDLYISLVYKHWENTKPRKLPNKFCWEAAECRTESARDNIKKWKFFAQLSSV